MVNNSIKYPHKNRDTWKAGLTNRVEMTEIPNHRGLNNLLSLFLHLPLLRPLRNPPAPLYSRRVVKVLSAPDGESGNGEAGVSPALSRNCNRLPNASPALKGSKPGRPP